MNTQNKKRQRNRKDGPGAENRSDTVMLTAKRFKIWDTLKQFHPYQKEISNVVRTLSNIGVKYNIIAATLALQGWTTFFGGFGWTEEDVKALLEGYRA